MAEKIFISLNHRDAGLATALGSLIEEVLGKSVVSVENSTKENAIPTGANWYRWIVNQVIECDLALILVTPNSVQAPWLMWEAGAVFGAAMAKGGGIEFDGDGADTNGSKAKVWPIVFQLDPDEIPSPIRDSNTQRKFGDRKEHVRGLLRDLFRRYHEKMSPEEIDDYSTRIGESDSRLDTYLGDVQKELLNAPAIPTPTVLAEWRHRVDELGGLKRASEVKQLQHWMEVTFGRDERTRDKEPRPQPVDLGIHIRLGDLYASNKDYPNAVNQYRLAQLLSSRDIFVLRRLGRFYLEMEDLESVEDILTRIESLDPGAFEANAECAALRGRFFRQKGDLRQAAESFSAALPANPDSYYLSNVAAEVFLELGDQDNAKSFFKQALTILERLGDSNVWTEATRANAFLAIGDQNGVAAALESVRSLKPSPDELQTIRRGLSGIAEKLDGKPDVSDLLDKLT